MSTCLFGDYKVTHEVWEDDGNPYPTEKIQWYRKSGKDYQPITTRQIFNDRGSELLSMFQDTINRTWNSLINNPETSGCIMEGVTDTSDITFDKIGVLVTSDGISLSSSLGLHNSCMDNDVVTAFYPWNVIEKYIVVSYANPNTPTIPEPSKMDGSTWIKVFGGKSHERGRCVTSTTDGGVVVAGDYHSNTGDFQGTRKGDSTRLADWMDEDASFIALGYRDRSDVFVIKLDDQGNILWKNTYSGQGSNVCNSITTNSDGDVLIAGWTSSSSGDFEGMGRGEKDIFVIKHDKNGNILWKKSFGGSGSDVGESIKITKDNGIQIIGRTHSNDGDFEGLLSQNTELHFTEREYILVMDLDMDGGIMSKRVYQIDNNNGDSRVSGHSSVATTSDDGIVITGETNCYTGEFKGMGKGGSDDVFVIKIDRTGGIVWKKTFGGNESEKGDCIITTSDDGMIVTGHVFPKSEGIVQGDFSGIKKFGKYDSGEIFVFKLDKDGSLVWKTLIGGSGQQIPHSIVNTLDGGILITGQTTFCDDGDFKGMTKGDGDVCVIKLDRDGRKLWTRVFGGSSNGSGFSGTGHDVGHSVTTTTNGGVIVTGSTSSNDGDFKGMNKGSGKWNHFDPVEISSGDVFVIKLDKNGNLKLKK